MGGLFDVDGPIMNALQDLMVLVVLNLFTILCCIPIFTAGAALTALHFTIMKMKKGKSGLYKLYFKEFKNNLKTMTNTWIILLFFAIFLAFDYWILYRMASGAGADNLSKTKIFLFNSGTDMLKFLFLLEYLGIFIWFAIFVWVFPYGARFVNSAKANLHNALLLATGKLPRTLLMMLFTMLVPFFLLVAFLKVFPLFVALGISLPAYLCSFIYAGVIDPMVRKAKLAAGIPLEDDEEDDEREKRLLGEAEEKEKRLLEEAEEREAAGEKIEEKQTSENQ